MLLSADTASASLAPLGRTFRGGRFGGDAHRKRFLQRLFNRKSGDGEVRVKTGSVAVRDKQRHRRVVEVGVGKGVVVLILRLAGIAGVNPDPLTLRERAALADARGRFEWEQTASLMALIVNLMRDPKKNKAVKAEDFNPYTVKEKAFLKAPLSVLRDVFVKK